MHISFQRSVLSPLLVSLLLAAACDSDDGSEPDGQGGESGQGSASLEEVFSGAVGIADELHGVSITDAGLIYVAGNTTEGDDPAVVVARYTADGDLDTDFGDGEGFVVLNVLTASDDNEDAAVPGGEGANAIVSLPDGGAAIAVTRNDGELGSEAVVVRVDESGELVSEFGEDGVASVPMTDWSAGDDWTDAGGEAEPSSSAYDLVLDESGSDERLVVFGTAPALESTGRVDNDRYIVRLMADDGAVDESFADDGVFTIDFGEKEGADSTRRGYVAQDGSIISAGYTNYPETLHHIFLVGLDDEGKPLSGFGFADKDSDCGKEQDGVICTNPFIGDGFAEAYAVAVGSDGKVVTTGYGEPSSPSSTEVDLLSFRFDEASLDTSYATNGGLIQDSGTEDRGRDIEALSDGRFVHVGKYADVAAVYLTDADGDLDEDFGDGGVMKFSDFSGNLRCVAVSNERVVAVGDDGLMVIFGVDD